MEGRPRLILSGANGYLASNFLEYIQKNNLNFFSEFFLFDKASDDKKDLYGLDLLDPKQQELLINKMNGFRKNENKIFIHTAFLKDLEQEKIFLGKLAKNFPEIYFVFFSSASVYGESADKKPRRVGDPCMPVSDYGRYKLEMELFIKKNFSNHLILRISNPYGKEKNIKGVWKIFETKILEQLEFELSRINKKLYGNKIKIQLDLNSEIPNEIVRDFIYIDDLLANLWTHIISGSKGIINLSSAQGMTLEEMSEKILQQIIKEKSLNPEDLELTFNYSGFKEGDIRFSVLYSNPI